MITKELHSFSEYVDFVADHVSENWRGYKTCREAKFVLEDILGAPKSFPATVAIEWYESDEMGFKLPRLGIVEMRPTLIPFVTKGGAT